MKLAEALINRIEIDKNIKSLQSRIFANSLIQEGTSLIEDPNELLLELYNKMSQFKDLIIRINTTNLATKLDDGTNLMEAIVQRDHYLRLYNILDSICEHANTRTDRYSKTEILNVPTINVVDTRKKMDNIAEKRRKIDLKIQSTNWTTELI
ncbi:hypothetical protein BB561_006622 [Smittium simulii]|uniref:Septicolysin n=1 Tax=Smittium simulii TaxID=133385 RepID=A0A2T9Y2R0_9FUNG|nr:hypothetical protein BB561_006622 [Smittium simulii]